MNPIHIALFYILWVTITLFFMVVFITYVKNRKQLYDVPEPLKELPFVSLIVPAYNEEKTIRESIDSLLEIDYPPDRFEIVVVNDGSNDRTAEIIRGYQDERVQLIDNKVNRGKAASLNIGIDAARGDFVACMDADTIVEGDVVKKALPHFDSENVGSVIVRVNVRKPKNWIEKIISVEYNMGLGFYLKIYSLLDCLYLTPGQFSLYTKKMLKLLGGFDPDSIVEDTELAYRMQKAGYRINCCLSANAYTNVPDNLRDLYYQRKRWYTGAINTFIKHRDVFFNRHLGNFGLFFMPVNYGGTIIAVALFVSTVYTALSVLLKNLTYFSLVGYDLAGIITSFLENAHIDLLSINIFHILCVTPFIANMGLNYIGVHSLGEKVRDNAFGFIAYLFFFVPYHAFWLLCLCFVASKNKVKWRESM